MNATGAERSPRKAKGQGSERREEILAAALKLFTELGVYAVSTRQIAQVVGISQPTLYAYFPTKDHIGQELKERAFDLLARNLAHRVHGVIDSQADLARLLRAYVDFGLENPDMYRIAFMEGAGPVGSLAWPPEMVLSPAVQSTYGVLVATVTDLHARGLTVQVDPQTLTQTIWAAKHGLVSLLISKPGFPWVEREHLITSHMAMIARGVWRD